MQLGKYCFDVSGSDGFYARFIAAELLAIEWIPIVFKVSAMEFFVANQAISVMATPTLRVLQVPV